MNHCIIELDEVRKIAKMSHLELTPAELERMRDELGSILGYVKMLEKLDVSEILPTASIQLDKVELRRDISHVSLDRDLVLSEAPKVQLDGFAVPGFMEEG